MSISVNFLDELRARTTLSTLLGRSIDVKKAGREFKACCPFHNEKTPSFTINDEKGFYHCFGCGAHGDAIRWMTDQLGLPFVDAVKELADAAGMEMPAPDPRAAEQDRSRDNFLIIMASADRFYRTKLTERGPQAAGAEQARGYITERGIDDATAVQFGLGYAPPTRKGEPCLIAAALGIGLKDIEAVGLVRVNPDNPSDAYDFFRGRLMIPIHDPRGRVIGFGARIIGPGEPKYINSPETPLFSKGRNLFNIHRAAAPARAAQRLIICEGYMDVIAFHRAGIPYSVAPCGTAVTEAQLAQAWKLVDRPTFCLDGDNAGRKAAVRAALVAIPMLEPGKSIDFVFPPDGQDPDDVLRDGGPEAVQTLITGTMRLTELLWRHALEECGSAGMEELAKLQSAVIGYANLAKNQIIRAAMMDDFADRWGAIRHRKTPQDRSQTRKIGAHSVENAVQQAILLGFMRFPGLILEMRELLVQIDWKMPEYEQISDVMLSMADQGLGMVCLGSDGAGLSGELAARGLTEIVDRIKASMALKFPFLSGPDDHARRQFQLFVAATVAGAKRRS